MCFCEHGHVYWWMFLCTFLFVYSVCELKRVHIYIFVWVYGVCVPLYICMCEVVLEIVVVVSMCVCGKKQVAVRVWVHLGADDSLWGSFYVGRQTKECGSVILREILYYAAVVLGRYTDTYRSHREMLKRKRERECWHSAYFCHGTKTLRQHFQATCVTKLKKSKLIACLLDCYVVV